MDRLSIDRARLTVWAHACAAAFQFLTRIPVPVRVSYGEDVFRLSIAFYPLVGAAIGLLLVAASEAAAWLMPAGPAGVLVTGLWVALTGALHLDGLMDTADGLMSHRSRERMLEIMKDSRVGAMGVIAGLLALLMKASLISALYRYEAPWSALILFAPIWSRWCMMWAIVLWPYARANDQGLGGLFRTATRREAALGTAIAVAITLIAPVLVDGRLGDAAMCSLALPFIAALTGWLVCRAITRKLGGLTGDTYGALNECVECALLAASVAFAHNIYG